MSTKELEIILPKEATKAERVNPSSLILYGAPKVGKTTAVSQLKNCLIIDVEKGTGFVDAVKIAPPEELGPVGIFNWLRKLADKIKADGKPYDYVVVDTLSQLDDFAEFVGTWLYMNSSQGKSFNRVDGKSTNPMLKPTDAEYESVHSLPQGFGYRWSRSAIMDMFDALNGLGKVCTIFICHLGEKYLDSKNNQEVVAKDLSLTGKVKSIVARKVDAIGYVYNEDNNIMVSFTGNDEKLGGNRAKHIAGYEGPLDWSKIFI